MKTTIKILMLVVGFFFVSGTISYAENDSTERIIIKDPTIYLKIPSCICLIEKSSVTLHSNKISMLLCQKLL